MKFVYGLVMTIIGGLGLLMTACGLMFLPAQGLGLIGLIPGVLLIWWAVTIAKKRFPSQQDPGGAVEPVDQEQGSTSETKVNGKD